MSIIFDSIEIHKNLRSSKEEFTDSDIDEDSDEVEEEEIVNEKIDEREEFKDTKY